jgi:histidinol dehydrogenase
VRSSSTQRSTNSGGGANGLSGVADHVGAIADAEGLHAHALSVEARRSYARQDVP